MMSEKVITVQDNEANGKWYIITLKRTIMKFNNSLYLIVLAIACLWACQNKDTSDDSQSSPSAPPPNIIFILADDLGYGDISCYGQQQFETPHIDRLAAQGMLFTDHYAGTAVCSPSRATLMAGQHTGHVAIRDNRSLDPSPYGFREREGQFPLADSVETMPEMLQKAGYVTGAYGKWGLGGPDTEGEPNKQGFDEFYGYVCQSLAHNYYPDHLWHNQEKIMLDGNDNGKYGAYSPALMQKEAVKFIEAHQKKPFFLFLPTPLPHAELIAPEEEMALFEGKLQEGKPYKGTDEGPGFRKGQLGSQEQPHAAFAAMVKILDDQVGEIMKTVDSLGLANNTLIIFTSDNGPHIEGGGDPAFFDSNGPLKGIKRDLYEGGIRVPLIMRWPGRIQANSTNDHPSAFWDFKATFAALAGVEAPENGDGISMLPTMLGKEEQQQKHPHLYWEYHGETGKQAVRMGKWKAVRKDIREGNETIELYDLQKDLGETTDVAKQYPKITQRMDSLMRAEHTTNPVFKLGYLDE